MKKNYNFFQCIISKGIDFEREILSGITTFDLVEFKRWYEKLTKNRIISWSAFHTATKEETKKVGKRFGVKDIKSWMKRHNSESCVY